jgi:hypothetical protein
LRHIPVGTVATRVVNVFLPCCYALASLCYSAGADAQASIGKHGGVDAIVGIMQLALQLRGKGNDTVNDSGIENGGDDERDALVQQFGCGALGNLIIECEPNAELVHRAGGIEAIVEAMEAHPGSRNLQEWALRALNNLCHYEALRRYVVNAGGLSAIRSAHLRASPTDAGESDSDENPYCREWTLEVLSQAVENLEQ